MIIQNGTRTDEKFVIGTVGNIKGKYDAAGMAAPSIIIFGEVVRLHKEAIENLAQAVLLQVSNSKRA